jgi:hypothetical protein
MEWESKYNLDKICNLLFLWGRFRKREKNGNYDGREKAPHLLVHIRNHQLRILSK